MSVGLVLMRIWPGEQFGGIKNAEVALDGSGSPTLVDDDNKRLFVKALTPSEIAQPISDLVDIC